MQSNDRNRMAARGFKNMAPKCAIRCLTALGMPLFSHSVSAILHPILEYSWTPMNSSKPLPKSPKALAY
jgi:hypothetical protein